MSRLSQILPILYFTVDVSILVFAFFGATIPLNKNNYEPIPWIGLGIAISLWLIIGYSIKLYQSNLNNGFMKRMISYSKSYVIFTIIIIFLAYLNFKFPIEVGNVLFWFVVIFLALNLAANSILVNIISRYRRRQDNIKYTLVAGVGDLALKISTYFESNPDFGFKIKGYLKSNGEECKVSQEKVVGTLKDIKEYLNQNTIDEIIIALPYKSARKKIKKIIHEADFNGTRVSYVPDYQGLLGKNFKIIHDGELDAVNVRQLPLDEIYGAVEKIVFDYIFSAIVILFLSPLLLIISALIKFDSPGPVFYCPTRIGRAGKSFKVIKFRTMYENDTLVGGTRSTQQDDPRITRVGKILRKYNLDELPQFLNVLLGEMSVVGPRPHRNFLNKQMKEHVDKYMLRHYFKPGITGWAQVNGWRGPTETETQISQRTAHDLWYIEYWSFMLDIKIIWMTVFSRKAYKNAF